MGEEHALIKFGGVVIRHAGDIITDDAITEGGITVAIDFPGRLGQESLRVHAQGIKKLNDDALPLEFQLLNGRRLDDQCGNDFSEIFLQPGKRLLKVRIQRKQLGGKIRVIVQPAMDDAKMDQAADTCLACTGISRKKILKGRADGVAAWEFLLQVAVDLFQESIRAADLFQRWPKVFPCDEFERNGIFQVMDAVADIVGYLHDGGIQRMVVAEFPLLIRGIDEAPLVFFTQGIEYPFDDILFRIQIAFRWFIVVFLDQPGDAGRLGIVQAQALAGRTI